MSVLQRFARSELVALLSLIAVAGVVAAFSAIAAAFAPSMFNPAGSAQLGFLGTIYFGVLPVVLLGAPAYAWLSHRRWATWSSVLLLGAWPGVVALFLDKELGLVSLLCGLAGC